MLSHVIETLVKVGHCLVSTCDLRLFKYHKCIALEKGLHNRLTCQALSHVLALKHCGDTALDLDPLLRSSLVKE
eukprot:8978913-Ditylum_brightwellii.AAC.1